MIRHTKAQRINGAEALALPESTTTIKLLTMSQFEQEKYDDAEYFFHPDSSRRIGYVQLSWYTPLAASLISNDSTKIKALTAELTELLEQDPNMRACIFTQFHNQLKCVRHAVKQEFRHVKVYQFHGGTDVKNREKHIRDFQSLAHPGPAVFLITYRAGSVGVTLTAATHVFLMEPCILPSAEVQAAGRIHRLGQTKPVGVTKFIYKDSCESSIMDLHKKIKQGDEEYIVGDELTRRAAMMLEGDI
jgi:SNF2 family DNA or RNA helicase